MRISGVGGPAIGPTTRRATADRHEPEPSETHALIAIEAPAPNDRTATMTRHPAAPFLAQLIATQMQAPQTRARRRATPEDAIAVYRSMTKPVARRHAFGKRA